MTPAAWAGIGVGVVGLIVTFAGMMVALGRVLQALDTLKEGLAETKEKGHKAANAIQELTVDLRLVEQRVTTLERSSAP